VSTRYYLDTSALVKLYHQEAGTEVIEGLFSKLNNSLMISELAALELYSTVARKLRSGEITDETFQEICKNFDDDCRNCFVVTPLTTMVSQSAKDLLRKYGKVNALGSLDALHLGAYSIAQTDGAIVLICSDSRLLEMAALAGLVVLNPENPPKN